MIQTATTDQAEAICNVLIRSISELCVLDHRCSTEILNQWLTNKTTEVCVRWINDPSAALLVAIDQSNVVGAGMIDRKGYIHLCYVAPEAVGNGYGKALVSAMEQLAIDWGVGRVILESTKTALPFYTSLGYRNTGTTQVFDSMESYHMAKMLVTESVS